MKTQVEPASEALPEVAGALSPGARLGGGAIVSYLVTVFMLLTLNFFLPRLMPGDPINAMLVSASAGGGAPVADASTRAALQRYYGLDRPLPEQYAHYLGGLFTGDLGRSIKFNQPVWELIGSRLPWTILLGGASILVALTLGVPAGISAGWRRGSRFDKASIGFFTAVANFPPFFVASVALYFFAVKLGWVPLAGATTPFADFGPLRGFFDVLHHLALPAVILGLEVAAGQFLLMRAGMVSEMGADYLLMGRAKGLTQRRLKYRYAARNALLPTVSLTAVMLSFAVAGTIFVERVFAYPGLGRLAFEAAAYRDYPLMQGTFLILSLAVVTFNLAADLALTRLDPRVLR